MHRKRLRFLAETFIPQQDDLLMQREATFDFDFALPRHIELDEDARRQLGIKRSRFGSLYALPPSFDVSPNPSMGSSFSGVLKDLFLPWKGDKVAAVRYHLEIRVQRDRGGAHRFAPSSLQQKGKKFIVPVYIPSRRSEQLLEALDQEPVMPRETLPGYTRKERFGWSVDAEDPTGLRRFYKNGNLCLSMGQAIHVGDSVPFTIKFGHPLSPSTRISVDAVLLRSVSARSDYGTTIIETGKVAATNPVLFTTHSDKHNVSPSSQSEPISRLDGCFQMNVATDGAQGEGKGDTFAPSFTFAALQVKVKLQFPALTRPFSSLTQLYIQYRLRFRLRLQNTTQTFEAPLLTPEILLLDKRTSATSPGIITRQVSHAQLDASSPLRPSTAAGPMLNSADMPPPYVDHLASSSVSVH